LALFYLSALASVCDPTRVAAAPIRLDPIAVQASSSWQGNSPERVADGNSSTVWNAGGSPRQWIQLDLGRTVALSKIRLLTHQVPAGLTTHEIWVGQSPSPDRQRLVRILTGWTADSQWLEHTPGDLPGDRLGNVRYVRIVTAGSPSWVSWREIEVFQGVEFAGYFRDAFDGVGPGDHPDGYSAETATAGANLTWIGGWDVKKFASKLETARALGVKAILDLNALMFKSGDKCEGGSPSCFCYYERLDENGLWRSNWREIESLLKTSGYLDTVAAFYISDEPYAQAIGRGTPPEVMRMWLVEITSEIRRSFPDKPIGVIVSTVELEPTDEVAELKDGSHMNGIGIETRHVEMFDWVGFDCYETWEDCGVFHRPMSYYVDRLSSLLLPRQRMIAVPGAFHEFEDDPHPDTEVPLDVQLELVDRLGRWHQQILSDGRYVAVVPFLWQPWLPEKMIGPRNMPWVKERVHQLMTSLVATDPTGRISPIHHRADNSWGWHGPFLAGNRNEVESWNAGAPAPQAIRLDLGGSTRITRVELVVEQVPDGYTSHTLHLGPIPIASFQGNTHDGQVLTWSGEMDASSVLVVTDTSPSWVAWREIRVFTDSPSPVCGYDVTDPGEECDADQDGLFGSEDFCVNVGGTQDFLARPRPRLEVGRINNDQERGNDAFSFRGQVQMPAEWSFASFDPNEPEEGANGGVGVVITDDAQRQNLGALLYGTYSGPGTFGWRKSGRYWNFVGDPGNPDHNGVRKMTITDEGGGRVAVSVTAKNSTSLAPFTDAAPPRRAIVVFGRNFGAAQRGDCGEMRFSLGECRWNSAHTAIACNK
jgi:hypothetical protein